MTGFTNFFADLLRGRNGVAAALIAFLLCAGTGCAHERTVVRHDSSGINYGVRKDVRTAAMLRNKKDRSRPENTDAKRRPPLKNPTPGLENPSGKPQDMKMDELRSIIAGAPTKGGGGAPAPDAHTAPPSGSGAPASRPVQQARDIPLPTR